MKESYAIITRLKSGESIPNNAATDFVRNSSGEMFTPTGQKVVHEGNINTVLAAAGGAGWEKVQATTANYAITKPTSGAGLDLHIEAGSLATLNSTNWPVPANGVDQLRIRNFSGSAKTITAGTGWTIVTADGNPVTGGSYSIPDDRAVEITLDPHGFAQVVPWGGEVSQATFDAGLAGKSNTAHNHDTTYTAIAHGTNSSNPHGVTKTQVGLSNADNVSDVNKPVSTAQQTALDGKAATTHAHTGIYEPADATILKEAEVVNTLVGTAINLPLSAAQGKALKDTADTLATTVGGKQATLVSGTNIRTVNGATLLGSGNITTSADLAGGAAATAYDDGLNAGNAVIDRATVAGQTILKYETVGSSTFIVPTGVTAIDYLIVAGGGGGGKSIGAGGGGGGLLTAIGYAVTPGATLAVSVGGGGAGATTTTAVGVNGVNSTLGAITPAIGGGGGTGQSVGFPSGPGGTLGGSGGGGARNNTTPGAGTTGQGFAGGSGSNTGDAYGAGGGGGAGGLGGNGSGTNGGNGGVGLAASITGITPTPMYAGGGGGGVNVGVSGLGGSNIGGNAGTGGSPGSNGTAKTGSGGGGSESTANAGSGGSGIIIVRFATQTRSYNALQSYSSNAAALTGGLLVGQFFNNTTTGGIAQVS